MGQVTDDICTVERAAENEKGVIAGLLQPYLAELSEFSDQTTAGNGRYQYPYLALYWKEPERHPFLIRVGKRVAGFALVRQVPGGTTMAEFYISSEHRKRGHGKTAAHAIFARFPGKWAISQFLTNSSAQTFWRRSIKTFGDGRYGERIETKNGVSTTTQRFTSLVEISRGG